MVSGFPSEALLTFGVPSGGHSTFKIAPKWYTNEESSKLRIIANQR